MFTYADGRPIRPEYLTHRFGTLVRQFDLPPIRLHDLRHGAATIAQRRGVASDATFRSLREEGGIGVAALPQSGLRSCLVAGHAVFTGVPVFVLHLMAGCGSQFCCAG
jgi:hypothetical protein